MTTINKTISSTESLHVRVPHDVIRIFDNIAQSIDRSRNWIFNEALKQYLDVQQWQIALIKNRLAQTKNSKAKLISHKEMMMTHEKRLKTKLGL